MAFPFPIQSGKRCKEKFVRAARQINWPIIGATGCISRVVANIFITASFVVGGLVGLSKLLVIHENEGSFP
jgi:hypothetical protein